MIIKLVDDHSFPEDELVYIAHILEQEITPHIFVEFMAWTTTIIIVMYRDGDTYYIDSGTQE